eukprot:3437530-Pyramimonas_sp.AAC.1
MEMWVGIGLESPKFARDWFPPATRETRPKPSRNPPKTLPKPSQEAFRRASVASKGKPATSEPWTF